MPLRVLAVTATLALIAPAVHVTRSSGPGDRQPRLMLWAWERPDDLRALPRGVGVAFLVQTITIDRGAFIVSRRRQALHVDEGTPMTAVTRIEAPGNVRGVNVDAVARTIADTGRLPMVSAVQIDFDARQSQREMYRRLLHAVHAAMPPRMPLSMTALASWCLDDNWLDELPVDEAVPMLFRMGPAEGALRREWPLRRAAAPCRGTVGVSLDEPVPSTPAVKRTYVFNPMPWTRAAVNAVTR